MTINTNFLKIVFIKRLGQIFKTSRLAAGAIVIFAALVNLSPCTENRLWTSSKGTTLQAEFLEMVEDQVRLKRADNGKILTLKIDKLSQEDQAFIRESYKKEAPENYDDPWPKWSIAEEAEITIVKEDPENKVFIYHSPHYEFKCDVRLKKSLVSQFAVMFEATFQAMKDLPLNFTKARNFTSDKRLKILLFEKFETYVENGGPPSSAGVYMSRQDIVLVPLTSLGVRTMGSSYIIDRDHSNKTLVHELVHQLTDRDVYAPGLRGWFTEGLAEYVAVSPYRSGRIKFIANLDEVTRYATGYSKKYNRGRAIGKEIKIRDLREYLLMPYSDFTANGNFNYAVAMLITTWAIHWDDNGSRRNLVAMLKAAREGKKGEELIDILRAGRSWEQFQNDITKAWRRKGVRFEFGNVSEYDG